MEGVPSRFEVATTIHTISGPMRDTEEYERIRNGHEISATETTAGSARLLSYLSAKTGGFRYALDININEGEWRITSYDLLVGAQVDYAIAVQDLTARAKKPGGTAD